MKCIRWILAPVGFISTVIAIYWISARIGIALSNDLLAVKHIQNPYGDITAFIAIFIGSITALYILPRFRIWISIALTITLLLFSFNKSSPSTILNETGMKSNNGVWAMVSWPSGAALAGTLVWIGERRSKHRANKGVQGTLHKVSGPLTPDVRMRKLHD